MGFAFEHRGREPERTFRNDRHSDFSRGPVHEDPRITEERERALMRAATADWRAWAPVTQERPTLAAKLNGQAAAPLVLQRTPERIQRSPLDYFFDVTRLIRFRIIERAPADGSPGGWQAACMNLKFFSTHNPRPYECLFEIGMPVRTHRGTIDAHSLRHVVGVAIQQTGEQLSFLPGVTSEQACRTVESALLRKLQIALPGSGVRLNRGTVRLNRNDCT